MPLINRPGGVPGEIKNPIFAHLFGRRNTHPPRTTLKVDQESENRRKNEDSSRRVVERTSSVIIDGHTQHLSSKSCCHSHRRNIRWVWLLGHYPGINIEEASFR